MKQIITFFFLFLFSNASFSQKVAIIGMNHLTADGFTFVATQNLPIGEVIFFTENEYDNLNNRFVDQTESVVKFTVTPAAITKGTVIFVKEISTDVFSVSCTLGGACGTAVKTAGSGNFALATDGDGLYAYAETAGDENPANGVLTIYAVMYTGSGEAVPPVNGGNLPANENPLSDFPTAIIVQGFPVAQPNRTEFITTTIARTNVTKAMVQNPTNYVHAQANADLSTIIFTTPTILPLSWLSIEGNLNNQKQAVLRWTVQESNVSNYEVQKSIDNVLWNTMATINSKGIGSNEYSSTDITPLQTTTYFRIKQIDVDGRLSYSTIVKLNFNKSAFSINVYPNPVKDFINISIGASLINTTVRLYNVTNKLLQTKLLETNFSQLSLQNYPSGIYLLRFENGEVEKIIKD
jgi:Secretion system C-terminal sorting domain